jgi:hypothetical protein
MALLSEYALIHDVFDSTSYTGDEVGHLHLRTLKEVLLAEGIVRDLRDGRWSALFGDDGRTWHLRGKELLKKLATQGRLRRSAPALSVEPISDLDWCRESLASHSMLPVNGVVTTRGVAESFPSEPLVASIDRLPSTRWWSERSSSVRLSRSISDYETNLRLVLTCSNSIMFIDPHLDPGLPRYRDFVTLVTLAGNRTPPPVIEIHRVCYAGSGPRREFPSSAEWQSRFSLALTGSLRAAALRVIVSLWDDFHDRYLITDLIGISLPNGFDTTSNLPNMTTWTRLGRRERDDIQREFDPASGRHVLRYRFEVP